MAPPAPDQRAFARDPRRLAIGGGVLALIAAAAIVYLTVIRDDGNALSAPELISRGDQICRAGQERFAVIQAEPPRSAADAADQTDRLVQSARTELSDLEGLDPPDELREDFDQYLEEKRRALALLEEGRDAAERKDEAAYTRAQVRISRGAGERLRLAREVGFRDCSAPQLPDPAELQDDTTGGAG